MSGLLGLLRADRDQLGCDVDGRHPRTRGGRGQRGVAGAAGEVGNGGVTEDPSSTHGVHDFGRDWRDSLADGFVSTEGPDGGR